MSMNKSRTIGIAAVCAAVGAAGGIAGTAASTNQHRNGTRSTGAQAGAPMWDHHRGPGGPPVHAEAVVLNKAGTGWITVTEDSGTVKSVSGNDLTITEGTTAVPYKDVTVTIPDGATVVRNGAKAAVSDIKTGDRVHVASSSDGTFVFAADASWQPRGPWGGGDHGGGPPGPPPAPGANQ